MVRGCADQGRLGDRAGEQVTYSRDLAQRCASAKRRLRRPLHRAPEVAGIDLAPFPPSEHDGSVDQQHLAAFVTRDRGEVLERSQFKAVEDALASSRSCRELSGQRGSHLLEDAGKDLLLGFEVMIDRAFRHAGAASDVIDAGRGEAVRGEKFARRACYCGDGGGAPLGLAGHLCYIAGLTNRLRVGKWYFQTVSRLMGDYHNGYDFLDRVFHGHAAFYARPSYRLRYPKLPQPADWVVGASGRDRKRTRPHRSWAAAASSHNLGRMGQS